MSFPRFLLLTASLAVLTACSSSTQVAPQSDDTGTDNPTDAPSNPVTPPAQETPSEDPAPETPSEDPAPETPTATPPATDSGQDTTDNPPVDPTTTPETPDPSPVTPPAVPQEPSSPSTPPVNDLSGGDDDSPTAVESASLVGPFIKDTSRAPGAPSSPQDVTLLMASSNWMEFSWAPSTDDQSVEAYEVFRDNQLIATVRGDTGYEHDYRSWLSTSYIDCNYTRYTNCADRQPTPETSYSYTVVAVDNEGLKSAPSDPVTFSTEVSSSAPPELSGYELVFNEEFNEGSLDRNRWKTALPWGPDTTINRETQYFVNIFGNAPLAYDPFVFTGETLQITGINTPPELLSQANNKPYLSGVITTSDYFEMTYGYVEMSAKLAGGEGLLSTFYLFNQDFENNKPEIDILEYIGSRPDKTYQTYHYYDSNRARYASGEKHSTPTMETQVSSNLSQGFHTYSVLWEPGLVIWFIDGQEVRRVSGPRVSDEPMNIIAQLVIGSEWIGAPPASVIPATLEIDYIKAWQRP